jgi:hypothetical protein
MRALGWIMFVLGGLFVLLLVLAQLGGGGIPFAAFAVAGIVTVTGWQLRTAGRGLLAPAPAASTASSGPSTASAAAGTGAAALSAAPTIELPLTPDVASAIRGATARSWRITLIVLVVGDACLVGLGALLGAGVSSSPDALRVVPLMLLMGGLFSAMVLGIWFLQNGLPTRRDIAGATYLRTTGPIALTRIYGGHMLRLADRAFLMKGRRGTAELRRLSWAVVDHSAHAHVILAVWDHSGARVFGAAGYTAEPPAGAFPGRG